MNLDPLDDLLGPPPDREFPLREALREQTGRSIRRRRWRRRLALAAAAALFFVAGMGVMAWLRPPPEPEAPAVAKVEPAKQEAEEKKAPAPVDPRELPPEKKAEILFAAGEKFLHEAKDYDAALRCYQRGLETADARMLDVSPEDDWLIMALKLDRTKEN
jgi:hypothetical protein